MTAANVTDIISRLRGCSGQAADAVSAYTQVKMEDASTLFKIPNSECPEIWIRLPKHKWPKSWSSLEDPVVPLERNLYGHLLAGLLWEKQSEKVLLEHGWGQIKLGMFFVNRAREPFLSVCMDDFKLAGKTENIALTWKILMKDVDLGEPTSFPDHVKFVLTEIGFCGNSLSLFMGKMCWDGIEQRGTWNETDGGYLWILVVWTLDPVASVTMLLTETCTL